MKLLNQTNGIRIALFATFLLLSGINLSAQYKLELEWQKQPGGPGLFISSITKSDNDSLLYVAGGKNNNNVSEYYIYTCNIKDGSVIKLDTVETTYNLLMSRDGKTLAAAGGWGVGLLDPQTFKRVYWDSVYLSDFRSLTYNEKSNNILITGDYSIQKREPFLKIYDLSTKSLLKEFSPSYFGDIAVKNASITDVGKYIIYGYETYTSNPNKTHYFVKMIDLEGKLIKDFGETSSSKFAITIDGKTLIYFDSKAMHFFNLETLKEIEGIQIGGADPEHIEMSLDGKFMLAGYGGGLVYYDLETKKSFFLNENSTWSRFKLNSNNSNLYYGGQTNLYKFKILPTTSITEEQNNLDLKINIIDNKLTLTNPQNHQINTLTAYDILGRTYPLSANGNEVDVSVLADGRYFLKVGLADGSLLDFGFVKE